jgi:antitoxin ParD1/3/4
MEVVFGAGPRIAPPSNRMSATDQIRAEQADCWKAGPRVRGSNVDQRSVAAHRHRTAIQDHDTGLHAHLVPRDVSVAGFKPYPNRTSARSNAPAAWGFDDEEGSVSIGKSVWRYWQWIDNNCQHGKMGKTLGRWRMDTMNIALPEAMKQFVQERVSEGGYSSVSEYIRELIRADLKRKAEERIDSMLLDGLDSGEPITITQDYWEAKKRKLVERIAKGRPT